MQTVLNKDINVFLNFLHNRYNIPIRLVQQTKSSDIYLGELRCANGTLALVKFVRSNKGNLFVVYDRNRREIYQCATLNTEGRTKQFLDKLVNKENRQVFY